MSQIGSSLRLKGRNSSRKDFLKYPIVFIKKGGLWPNEPLETADPHFTPVDYFDLRLFKVGGYYLSELNPHPRSSWMFVRSSELLKFLKPFMREGFLMVSGYSDGIDLTEICLKEDDELLLFMELVGVVDEGVVRDVPSALTMIRKGYVRLDEGLYGVPIPWRSNKRGFLFVTELMNYTVLWFLGSVDFNNPEDVYESLCESWQLANDLTIPIRLPLKTAVRVTREELQELVKRIFNAHVSGDYTSSPCEEMKHD